MDKINIVVKNIVELEADCIVNAANSELREGAGVCGAIFEAAGRKELALECEKLEVCAAGKAVITPAFNLKAKYIIHTVGPYWYGGNNYEAETLANCYKSTLELAVENDIHSIVFPLISSGIYMYPLEQAWQIAMENCVEFLHLHNDYDMEITFAVLWQDVCDMGLEALKAAEAKCE